MAPTVLDALGFPIPAEWHGLSLFGELVRERTFFAVPWSTVLLGFRAGAAKVNYEVISGKLEYFDLGKDAEENHNLASELGAEKARSMIEKIWSWKNTVDDHYAVLKTRRRAVTNRDSP